MFATIIVSYACVTGVFWLVSPWITEIASNAFEKLYDSVERKAVEQESDPKLYTPILGAFTVLACGAPIYVAGEVPSPATPITSHPLTHENIAPMPWLGPYITAAGHWLRVLAFLRHPWDVRYWLRTLNACFTLLFQREPDGGTSQSPRIEVVEAEASNIKAQAETTKYSNVFRDLCNAG